MICVSGCFKRSSSGWWRMVAGVTSSCVLLLLLYQFLAATNCIVPVPFSIIPHYRPSQELVTRADHHDNISASQVMYGVPGRGVYLYAAYWDNRQVAAVAIRVFGIHRNDTLADDFHCLWNSSTGVMWQVKGAWTQIDNQWPLHNRYFAFMITCNVPDLESKPPDKIMLLPSAGQSVQLPLRHYRSMYDVRSTLGVCVKPVTGEFSVSRVIEWVELNLAAGYTHFVMYDTDWQGASRFVLDYYASRGIITIIRFPFLTAMLELAERQVSLNGELRYALYQQVYLLALHDCLHRFASSFQYLTMIDLDEVIIPKEDVKISEVVKKAEANIPEAASFMFYTTWHFKEFTKDSDVPEYLYMQRYAKSPTETTDQPKSIINTDRVLTVNWHGVLDSLNGTLIARYLLGAWEYACVHHYRSGTCDEHFHSVCSNMTGTLTTRTEITRYRDRVEPRVRKVMDHFSLH